MISFLSNLFTLPYRGIQKLAHAVSWAVRVVWNGLVSLGRGIRTAWGYLLTGLQAVGWVLERLGYEVYLKLRWIITVLIPHAITAALAAAASFAQRIVNDLRAWAVDAWHYALSFAQTIVNTLSAWAHDAVSWLTDLATKAWNLIVKTATLVYSLLDDPVHLAEWAAGAIAHAVGRWLLAGAEGIARFVFSNIVKLLLESANLIESIVADLF